MKKTQYNRLKKSHSEQQKNTEEIQNCDNEYGIQFQLALFIGCLFLRLCFI